MASKRAAADRGGVWTDAQRRVTALITLMAALMALLVNFKTLGLSSWLSILAPDVANAAAHRIVLFPRADTLRSIGEPAVITATVTDARGGVLAGATLYWKSSDSSVASVDSSGAIIARSAGRANIEVRVRDIVASVAVLVRPEPAQIVVGGDSILRLGDGDSLPLNAHVVDARGHRLQTAKVAWTSSDPSVLAVDSMGQLRAIAPGGAIVTASLGGLGDTVRAMVSLRPAELVVVSGDAQRALAGRALAAPVVFQLRSRTGQPIPGSVIVVTSADGEGTISPDTARTDATGRVRVNWKLGPTAGVHRLLAMESSLDSVAVVRAEADPSPGNSRVQVVATDIAGTVLRPLSEPLRIRVTDSLGAALADVRLAWSALDGGKVAGVAATDSAGYAEGLWTLGPRSGTQRLVVQVGSARYTPAITIPAKANAGAPVSLSVLGGNKQVAAVGTALTVPITLLVKDSTGNVAEGARVIARPSAGALSDTSVITGADGKATVRWTMGTKPGPHRLELNLVGARSEALITATARTGGPTAIAITTRPAGTRGALRIVAALTDEFGNPIAGTPVAFAATAGTLSAAQVRSDASGRAQVSWTPGAGTGQPRISAKVTGTKVSATHVVPTPVSTRTAVRRP
jgi:hypothetical protein